MQKQLHHTQPQQDSISIQSTSKEIETELILKNNEDTLGQKCDLAKGSNAFSKPEDKKQLLCTSVTHFCWRKQFSKHLNNSKELGKLKQNKNT